MNFSNAAQSAAAYRSTAIRTASGGHLVLMLYDGAINALSLAETGFGNESAAARNEAVSNNLIKAKSILAELQGTLDIDRGGEFATNMYRLYDYMLRRIFDANLNKEREPVAEVCSLLRDIRDAWREMMSKQEAAG